jgi:hypothetical protein
MYSALSDTKGLRQCESAVCVLIYNFTHFICLLFFPSKDLLVHYVYAYAMAKTTSSSSPPPPYLVHCQISLMILQLTSHFAPPIGQSLVYQTHDQY